MKTFERWLDSWIAKLDSWFIPVSDEQINQMRESWNACNSEWRSFLEQEYSVKSFDEWFKNDTHFFTPQRAWDFQDKQWRHVLANKMMALDLKQKKIEHLDVVIKNLQASRQADEEFHDQRLKEAEEVIAFYADKKHWHHSEYTKCGEYERIVSIIDTHPDERIGGKRAREYQAKYEVKK